MNALTPTERARFLGGSDIAAVLGLSPWMTPVALWAKKTQPQEERPETGRRKPLARGHRWESVVAEMLLESIEASGILPMVVGTNERYVDPAHDFMACEIDFELQFPDRDDVVNCELKTVHPFKSREWGESQSDELPTHYTAQAMWGLGITGRQTCIVAALFGADELRTYTVERDDDTIAWMREEALRFWTQHVLTGIAPAPVALRDLDTLFPKDSEAPALIADPELTRTLLRMRALKREIDARNAEWDVLEFDVKRALGDCTSVVVGSETKEAATWKARPHTYLDQTALKEAHPKLVKEFTRKGESRVFTLKPFSTEGTL